MRGWVDTFVTPLYAPEGTALKSFSSVCFQREDKMAGQRVNHSAKVTFWLLLICGFHISAREGHIRTYPETIALLRF